MWLGIDFGTCYSSAAFLKDGIPHPVKFGANIISLPSSVFLDKQGKLLIGKAADNKRQLDPTRYRREFKRDLGTKTPYQIGESEMLPEELVREVLLRIKNEADKQSPEGEPYTKAVITVPANYQKTKRELMIKAAREAGFSEVEVLDEPVAAATYFASRSNSNAETETVLVYDLGGGTFDAALILRQGSVYQPLAVSVGHERLGGIDFDRKIFEDLLARCSPNIRDLLVGAEPSGADEERLVRLRTRLWAQDECRELKHHLSEDDEANLTFPQSARDEYILTREEFNRMIGPLVEETCELSKLLVDNAGLCLEQVDKILLVGGSSRMPYVQETVAETLGRPVVQVDDPELAICLGAALHGLASGASEFVVAQSGGGHYKSITEAIRNSRPGMKILVRPGLYRESLTLDRQVEIIGDGSMSQIVIESSDRPCLMIKTDRALVRGMTIRGREGLGEDKSDAIEVSHGTLFLEECDVTSGAASCLSVSGAASQAVVRKCSLHDARMHALKFVEGGGGLVEDCNIFGNQDDGVIILGNSNPTFRRCKLYDGKSAAITVAENGQGSFDHCEIYNHSVVSEIGIAISVGIANGNPSLSNCKIYDGGETGVAILVIDNGEGKIERCDIYGHSTGLLTFQGGNPRAIDCKLHGCEKGIMVREGGKGLIEDCDIFENSDCNVYVSENGDITVKESRIRDSEQVGVFVNGAGGTIEKCELFRNKVANLLMSGGGNPNIIDCDIHDSEQNGVLVSGPMQAVVEGGSIYKNMLNVHLTDKASAHFRGCRIFASQASGVRVEDKSTGLFEGCDIYSNGQAGVAIVEESDPVFSGCKVHDNTNVGVLSRDKGRGRLNNSEIYGNPQAGVASIDGGDIHVSNCRINGNDLGIGVQQGGSGTFENCDISDNKQGPWSVEEGSRVKSSGNTYGDEDVLRTLTKFDGSPGLYLHPNIPDNKLNNARAACSSSLPNWEKVYALVDCTLFGSAKHCVLFARKGVYFSHPPFTGYILYRDFPSCDFRALDSTTIATGYEGKKIELAGSSLHAETVCQMLVEIKNMQ